MEKTDLMLKYEKETRETLDMAILAEDASGSWYGYIDMVDAKATAYDRLMSGGKKTLKEWANFLGLCVSINQGLVCFCSYSKPMRVHNGWLLAVDERPRLIIPMEFIDFAGDWEDSLTIPDGWEEK